MSQTFDPVVIAAYARTPMGGFQGVFSGVKATELGAVAVRAAVERSGVDPAMVGQIFMGCVPAKIGRGHDGQQDVWVGHAGCDHGP